MADFSDPSHIAPAQAFPPPEPPPPLSPTQARAARARQVAFITEQVDSGKLPDGHAPGSHAAAWRAPARKRFRVEDLRRLPLDFADVATRQRVNATSATGRLLPQALQETFGLLPEMERVWLGLAIGPHDPPDSEPSRVDVRVLRRPAVGETLGAPGTTVEAPAGRWYVLLAQMEELHPQTRLPGFNAAIQAQELYRLYLSEQERRAASHTRALRRAQARAQAMALVRDE